MTDMRESQKKAGEATVGCVASDCKSLPDGLTPGVQFPPPALDKIRQFMKVAEMIERLCGKPKYEIAHPFERVNLKGVQKYRKNPPPASWWEEPDVFDRKD
jgi:hypothetical protein